MTPYAATRPLWFNSWSWYGSIGLRNDNDNIIIDIKFLDHLNGMKTTVQLAILLTGIMLKHMRLTEN